MEAKPKSHALHVGAAFVVGVIVGAALFGGSSKSDPPGVAVATVPSAPAPAAVVLEPAPTPAPEPPAHFYVFVEGGEYGYEKGLSEADEHAGLKSSPLMMIRLVSSLDDGEIKFESREGASRIAFSCKVPCEMVRATQYFNGQQTSSNVIRAAEGSVLWGIVNDAMLGKLEPWSAKHPA